MVNRSRIYVALRISLAFLVKYLRETVQQNIEQTHRVRTMNRPRIPKEILLISCCRYIIANLSSDWINKRTRAAFDIQSATKMETWRKNFRPLHVTYQLQAPDSFTKIQYVVGIWNMMGKKCLCVQAKNGLPDPVFDSSVYENWWPKVKTPLPHYGVFSDVNWCS